MNVRWSVFATCVVILKIGGSLAQNGFEECFRKDSISCLQTQLFKAARAIVDNSTIELFDGIGLIQIGDNEGKSFEQRATEEKVASAKDVQSRQEALETYLIQAGENLWRERTLTWNPAQAAKALANAIPDTLTTQLTSLVLQAGRAKKKQLRMLIPLLIAFKLKIVTLASIAMMVIALIAKKAILAAAVSLVITGTTGLKSLLSLTSKPAMHASEVMGYQAAANWGPSPLEGFSSYGDSLSSHYEPAPQHQTFIGHKGG